MNRNVAARVAEDTMAILEQGQYRNARNETVDIGAALTHAIDEAVLYRIEDIRQTVVGTKGGAFV
ncbi:DUF2263 domain-containing protein [Paenibacillus sp. 1011MAR3C5]|uniref:poly(ADP-ribose) glycohydrolase domain-containing protein n=1 Tax=Paenibacillus sp. 1011MAR3C5 TaxID=1675787 RepID=UPI000E6C466C|nr:poly(ADP-ribose) glycohydrolase domain-containing protein [Paenibacillus sp. 1011MAR3C5]RJE87498.1 DUF2263 domain-containing protein [Paenibacillus sp. 1011MAR3C5]